MSARTAAFTEVVRDVSGGNAKLPQSAFQKSGVLAVVDQGQEFVAGFTDDDTCRFRSEALPVVVFGDHTKAIKYVDFPFAMGADGVKVLKPTADCDTKYLYHFLRQARIPDAGYSRHYKFLKELRVPLPPLPEQRRIAAILDKADALRAKRREAIAKLDQLLQSVFLDMFGDPATNSRNWNTASLSDLALEKMSNGIFKKNHEYSEEGTPVVWVEELFRGLEINVTKSRTIEPSKLDLDRYGLATGDLLFCRSSLKLDGIGYNNVYLGSPNAALFECHLIRLRLDENVVDPVFMNFLLRLEPMRARIKQRAKTSTMTTIDQKGLGAVQVFVPPLNLQIRFRSELEKHTSVRGQHAVSTSLLDGLFRSLQERAFAGAL